MGNNIWIEKIILWPVDQRFEPRVIKFENSKLNIIYGDSRTGKSALIPIIDYCMCSTDCRIPVGIIRDYVSWYGILLRDGDEELLLCRAEPGRGKQTSEMYFELGRSLGIPKRVTKNTTAGDVKDLLNQHFGFSQIPIDESDGHEASRSSFRDAAAVLYQPQSIIANPEALFYKLDTLEHKLRFSRLFPYLIGAITATDLVTKLELESLKAELSRLTRDAGKLKQVSEEWLRSAEGKITKAIELGVSTFNLDTSEGFDDLVEEIERISNMTHADVLSSVSNEGSASEQIAKLGADEMAYSAKKAEILNRLRRVDEAIVSYSKHDETMESLSEYIGITDWLVERASKDAACPVCGQAICDVPESLEDLQLLAREMQTSAQERQMKLELSQERATLQSELKKVKKELNAISVELRSLEEIQNAGQFQLSEVERFVGELRASLGQYKAISGDSEFESRIRKLQKRKDELEQMLSNEDVSTKIQSAVRSISSHTKDYLKTLDVENSEWETVFDYRSMTLQIRDDTGTMRLLSEIGSASNWLSYHVAFSLAIQEYIQTSSPIITPGFLFYDQPSQVYFPHEIDFADSENAAVDRDKEAVRKIFETFDGFLDQGQAMFQIIVTEHAGKDIWGELPSVNVVEHWTANGEKLIPSSWVGSEQHRLLIGGSE